MVLKGKKSVHSGESEKGSIGIPKAMLFLIFIRISFSGNGTFTKRAKRRLVPRLSGVMRG